MSEFLSLSQVEWLKVFLTAGMLLLSFALVFGMEFGTKKVPKDTYRPTRSNLRGRWVNTPYGLKKIDWKKGYNSKYQMLYFEGEKLPQANVVVPNLSKCMNACPEATIWPESMEGVLFGDPRGVVLRLVPSRMREVSVLTSQGRAVVSRNVFEEKQAEKTRNLLELQLQEDLANARKSAFESQKEFNYLLGEAGESFGKAITPFISLQQKGKGGG